MARFSRSDFTLESFRRQLANVDALPQLCVLGLVSGVITGAVMVAFRLLLEAVVGQNWTDVSIKFNPGGNRVSGTQQPCCKTAGHQANCPEGQTG